MREAFRSNDLALEALSRRYDWVLNAKSTLLSVKLAAPAEEFAGIVDRVSKSELRADSTAQRVE